MDEIPPAIVQRLSARSDPPGVLSRWLTRLGYRAEPSDVEIIVSRYRQEQDAAGLPDRVARYGSSGAL